MRARVRARVGHGLMEKYRPCLAIVSEDVASSSLLFFPRPCVVLLPGRGLHCVHAGRRALLGAPEGRLSRRQRLHTQAIFVLT